MANSQTFSSSASDLPGLEPAQFEWKYEGGSEAPAGARLTGLGAFRAGTHTNSRGKESDWTVDDLHAMADNFKILAQDGSFKDVPMRVDHSFSLKDVIGYISDVYVKGEMLFVDVDITEPEEAAKYERGTYRARSAEIGKVKNSKGKALDNVLMGLAFVDIPAVSGLYSKPTEDIETEQGEPAVEEDTNSAEADVLAAEFTRGRTAGLKEAEEKFARPAHRFTIAGEEESNYEIVQAHIDRLEAFQAESIVAARTEFVDSLVTGNVVPAPQAESLKSLVLGMTDDQFSAYKEIYADMPAHPAFGSYGPSGPDAESHDSGPTPEELVIANAEAIVEMHRLSGMSEEEIAKTPSAQKLAALKGA